MDLKSKVVESDVLDASPITDSSNPDIQRTLARANFLLASLGQEDDPSNVEVSGLADSLRRCIENMTTHTRELQPINEIKSIFGHVLPDEIVAWTLTHASLVSTKTDSVIKNSSTLALKASCESIDAAQLKKLAAMFVSKESLTSFEIIEGGIIKGLIAFLASQKDLPTTTRNLALFIEAFFSTKTPIQNLLKKLQELLSRNEHYELLSAYQQQPAMNHAYGFGRPDTNPVMQLTRQIRIKLMPIDGDSVISHYRPGVVVSVPAIVSVKQLEDFLRVRGIFIDANNPDVVREPHADEVHHEEDEESIDEYGNRYDDDDMEGIEEDYEEGDTNISAMLLSAEEERKRSLVGGDEKTETPVTSLTSLNATEGIKIEERTERTYADATLGNFKLDFSIGGRGISRDETIFGAVFGNSQTSNDIENPNIWNEVHTISYEKSTTQSNRNSITPTIPQDITLIDYLQDFNADSEIDTLDIQILNLLQIINHIRTNVYQLSIDEHTLSSITTLSQSLFINNKLTAKINKQLDEPLIVASRVLPTWCKVIISQYPFILPLDTRLTFLQSTAFGYTRSISRWQQSTATSTNQQNDTIAIGRVTRQKIRIARQNIVLNMMKMMERYGSGQSYLEIEFNDECGTGLGPTLEFYSMVCERLQRISGVRVMKKEKPIVLWRGTCLNAKTQGYVSNTTGLFPECIKVNKNKE